MRTVHLKVDATDADARPLGETSHMRNCQGINRLGDVVSPGNVNHTKRWIRTRCGETCQFCGCGAALRVFGRIVPELNLAANWLRFPRTSPAPGTRTASASSRPAARSGPARRRARGA